MSASNIELAVELVPLVLLGIVIYRLLLSVGFHNTKYLSTTKVENRPRSRAK